MFERILTCLDGSEMAEQILPFAIEQAQKLGSTLILMHVVHEPSTLALNLPGVPAAPLETAGMRRHFIRHEGEAQEYLQALAADIAGKGVKVEQVVMAGRAGEAIVDYAKQNDIGMIALATHGRSGLGKALFGSVADYVLGASSLPLLLIKPH